MLRGKLRSVAASLAIGLLGTGVAAVATAPAAQAYSWTNCYVSMSGRTYCYKQCTYQEWRDGCNNGWYYWNTWYA